MKKLVMLFVMVITINYCAIGQDFLFRVIISKGDNSLRESNNSEWQPLKIGSRLDDGYSIKVSENSYVALLASSGETIELKNNDTREYSIEDLNGMVNPEEASLIKRYTSYVVSKMTTEERENNRKAYASITGAVERDITEVHAYLKKSSVLYDSLAIIRWEPLADAEYEIIVQNLYSDELHKFITIKNSITINFADEKLVGLDMVIVSIAINGGIPGEYAITKVTKDRSANFEKEINELREALDSSSAFDNLVLAEFFEQNNLILDASTCYEKALSLESDIQYFKDVYVEFLMRNGFGIQLQ